MAQTCHTFYYSGLLTNTTLFHEKVLEKLQFLKNLNEYQLLSSYAENLSKLFENKNKNSICRILIAKIGKIQEFLFKNEK